MNRQTVQEILGLPYQKVLISDEESGMVTATVAEFPGCIAEGASEVEALTNLNVSMEAWVESVLARHLEIPNPTGTRDYSGKFPLRLPRTLHEKISRFAEQDGVSLNTFIVTVLSERVGLRQGEDVIRRALQQLSGPRVVVGVLQDVALTEPNSVFELADDWSNDLTAALPASQILGPGFYGRTTLTRKDE